MLEKESIIRYLRERAQRPVRLKEIARALEVDAREYRRLRRLLRQLEEAGEIYRVRRRRYALPERINLVVGRLQVIRAGHGFVIPEVGGEDVFVASSQLRDAYDGDRVIARVERRQRGRKPEGTIVRVLERARTKVVGVYHRSGRYSYLVPLENAIHRDVFIPPRAGGKAGDGSIVVARIVDWGSDHHDPVGEVVEILGRPGEAGVDVLAIVHSHELPADFPRDVLDEAEKLRAGFDGTIALEERTDFRATLTFTIDPIDAKDHDDAISIERLASDRWRVGVHIADVSHFVREGSRIDQEALNRGTSVYLVDRVLPMLPEPLSGDLCSLKPEEDRYTLSACLELNSAAEVNSIEFTSGVIRSRYALAYEEAQEIVDGVREADVELREALQDLRHLAFRLRERRQARGGLDFDLPEARVIVNSAGEPTTVQRILRLDTHRLIEEFMILVNESVARSVESRGAPFIYRVHEAPDPDRLERLREFIAGLGLKLARDADTTPRALQRLLTSVEGRPEEPVVSTLVLRSMKQARYSAERAGHFGLGSRLYTHFTSPIRRYPDLVAHRIVRLALLEGRAVPEELAGQLGAMARHSSARERQAMEAERESVELKKMEYLERHLGDVFEGTITGVTSYGMFVLLDDVLAEGLVHVSQLADDYYHYLEEEYALVGELKRRRFRLGDRAKVQVIKVDRAVRELDLGLHE
ncbi:MAG: ribonuclease R [Gemmatimonadota bacterium]|nr:MAG: ribonuclease R [Gemmatimonadota bacterium]